jgi:GT2 family glycosyltransferase
MFAKRNLIAQVGCFTADYFMYSEDMDLCVKVAKTGSKIYYVPEAKIVHHAGGSSSLHEDNNFSDLVIRDSLIRFLEVHRGRSYALSYRASTVFISICRLIILAAISPIAIHPEGYRFLSRAVSKWSAVLAWSVGLARKRDNQRPSAKANASGDNVWGEL